MFLSLDGTFFIQLINFVIFFAILNVVFMRPVARAITKRREYINSVTADYDHYQAEAKALRTQAEAIRGAARREAEQLAAQARAETSNETARLSTEFSERASAEIQQAQRTVDSELQAARAGGARTVEELARDIFSHAVPELAR